MINLASGTPMANSATIESLLKQGDAILLEYKDYKE
jgi:hypothetical protein